MRPPPPVTGPANVTCTFVAGSGIPEGGSVPTITVEMKIDSGSETVRNCVDVGGQSDNGAPLPELATSDNESCVNVHTNTTSTSTSTSSTTINGTTSGGCNEEPCGRNSCTEYRVGSSKLVVKTLETGNQFGYDRLKVLKPLRLCLPTAKRKEKSGTPPPIPTGSHFVCYSVAQVDRPAPHYPRVALDDQFWTTRNVAVLRLVATARRRRRPVLPGRHPSAVPNPGNKLEYYAVRSTSSFPGADVFVTNQFVSHLEVRLPKGAGQLKELCVPSVSKLT